MKIYIISVNCREDDGWTLSVHSSKEGAISALKKEIFENYNGRDVAEMNAEYGGNPDEGTFYTEEATYTIVEKELLP